MRILQIFNQYRFHGGEEAWVEKIPNLVGDFGVVRELRFSSESWKGPGSPSPIRQIQLMGNNPESRASLREAVESFSPDVLLFHNIIPVGSLGLYQEAKTLGIPVLQYIHNFRPFSPVGTLWVDSKINDAALRGNVFPEIFAGAWQNSKIKTAILAFHLKHALANGLLDCIDHWLAISDFMRSKFLEAGVPPEKISVLHHCWDAAPTTRSVVEGDHYLFLGRLVPEKGIISLLDAWQDLELKLGHGCPKLVIAGDGPMEQLVRDRVKSMVTVDYAGFLEGLKKAELLASARALMVPSIWWEPLGLTAFEAFSYQRPAIAARSGGLPETVIDGQTGWTHRPSDAADLASAVLACEETGTGGRARLGKQAAMWLAEHASPTRWREDFLRTCRETSRK